MIVWTWRRIYVVLRANIRDEHEAKLRAARLIRAKIEADRRVA